MKKLLILLIFILLGTIYLIFNRHSVTVNETPIVQTAHIHTPTNYPPPTKTPVSTLPDHYLIKTAFIPQAPEKIWSEPWQDACEEAAILNVYYYYQHQNPDVLTEKNAILSMIDYENTHDFGISLNITQMSNIALNYLHLTPKVINNPNLDQIKSYVSRNIPVIVPTDGKILFQENSHFKDGGPWYHNIVILGYNDTTGQFTVHDVGTQFGAYFHYSYPLLLSAIHDLPDSGKPQEIASGAKNVLILLK